MNSVEYYNNVLNCARIIYTQRSIKLINDEWYDDVQMCLTFIDFSFSLNSTRKWESLSLYIIRDHSKMFIILR